MATGKSGSFDLSGTNGITLRLNWSETYEITTNKSVVRIDSIQVKSSTYSSQTYYLDGIIKINGDTIFTMDSSAGYYSATVNATGSWYTVKKSGSTVTGYTEVEHNSDGSKSVTIDVTGNNWSGFRGFTVSGAGGNNWKVEGTKSVSLTDIPRASTIGGTDAHIGATSIIVITKKADAYTHSVRYRFGSLAGYIKSDGSITDTETKFSGTNVAWSIPTNFYAQIPNNKSGSCTLSCTTYSGATQIGDVQTCTITLTAAESACKPSVSGNVTDINDATIALTGDSSKLVRYYSTARCVITAAAKNSATIKTTTIGGRDVTGGYRNIENVEDGNIIFMAADSRGYSGSDVVNCTVIPYVRLTNNATCARTDPTSGNATLKCTGAWFNGSFGVKTNALTITYRVNSGTAVTAPAIYSGNTYSAAVALAGLDYTKSHTVTVTVSDALETVSKTLTIMQGVPVFDWGENDISFNVPAYMENYLLMTKRDIQCGWFDPDDIPANTYRDCTVDFDIPFAKNPRVVVGIYSNTQSYNYHYLAPVVLVQSTTGFTVRIFNASGVELSPTINWIAATSPESTIPEPSPSDDIPSYCYTEASDVAAKIRGIQDTGHRVLVFGCVSDAHPNYGDTYQALSRQSLHHGAWALGLVGKLVEADFVANLGDNAWENNDTGDSHDGWHSNQAYTRQAMTGIFDGGRTIRIPGNHDQSTTVGNVYSYIGAYNRFDVAGQTPERGYGYIDLTDKKVRVIALNTSDYRGTTGGYDLSYEQKKWFMEALDLSDRDDAAEWGIVILSHFPLDFPDASDYNTVSEVQAILAAYVHGGSVNITVNSACASANSDTVTEDFGYDYGGKNAAGILLNAHGHLHNGAFGFLEGCGVPRICAFNTCFYLEKSDTYGEIYDVDTACGKTAGTAEDTAVTFYAVDRTAQTIHAFVYGAGVDRQLYYGEAKQYTVTYALTHVTSSNSAAAAVEGSVFTTALTPEEDAQITSVTVTMGGTDVTADCYGAGVVNIPAVTGDIVISAVAQGMPWSETVSDIAVAIRSVWHFNIHDGAAPNLDRSNSYAALAVTTANDYPYTDRESNTVYLMPVPAKATHVAVTNSDGSACTWRFLGLKENGSGGFTEVFDSATYGDPEYSFRKGTADYILISAYHTDGSSWAWGYDDTRMGVTFSND